MHELLPVDPTAASIGMVMMFFSEKGFFACVGSFEPSY
jgi:hypothetical protein